MSNQVYLNSTDKIFNWNGINAYLMKNLADVQLPAASPQPNYQSIIMSNTTASSVQVHDMVIVNPLSVTGRIVFERDGMYSVKVILTIRGPASTASVIPLISTLKFARGDAFDGYTCDSCENFIPISASQSSVTHQLSYTGFIPHGDALEIRAANKSTGPDIINVIALESSLLVTRLY